MVRKREDGRWEGRIVIGHKENGDSIFRYIYADTQKELTAKLRQNINAYQGVDLTEESKMTLSQWLDKWLDTYMTGTVRESTLDGYRRDLNNHVKPYLGEKPLLKITPADLSELYQALLERGRVVRKKASGFGLSPTTVHGIHTTLHHALPMERHRLRWSTGQRGFSITLSWTHSRQQSKRIGSGGTSSSPN
mgnify:CR=1 FL=1